MISLPFPVLSATYARTGDPRAGPGRAAPGRRRFPTAPQGGELEAPAGHAVHRRVADSFGRHLTNRDIGDRLQSRPVTTPPTAPSIPGGAAPRRRNGRGRRSQPSRRWRGARPAEG